MESRDPNVLIGKQLNLNWRVNASFIGSAYSHRQITVLPRLHLRDEKGRDREEAENTCQESSHNSSLFSGNSLLILSTALLWSIPKRPLKNRGSAASLASWVARIVLLAGSYLFHTTTYGDRPLSRDYEAASGISGSYPAQAFTGSAWCSKA
jgi:hypothetical protein